MHYKCATATTQIKLPILAHCSLYTSAQLHAHHQYAEQWSSHHTIQFQLQPDTLVDIRSHLVQILKSWVQYMYIPI